MDEHDEFDLMMYSERKRTDASVQIYATITITETYTVGLTDADNARIEIDEKPGENRRDSVQAYVEKLHKWGVEGQGNRNVRLELRPA